MTETSLSDLFFNHTHPRYDALFGDLTPPDQEAIREAIREDADEFAAAFPWLGKSGEWFAADFLKRL